MAGNIGVFKRFPYGYNRAPWNNLLNKLKPAVKTYLSEIFLASQRNLENLSSKKLKILFSKREEWEPLIRKDFRYTHHELDFGGFLNDDLEQYDLLVPLTIVDLEYLNSNGHLIKKNPIPIPSQECLDLCNDKYLFYEKLVENGFGKYTPRISSNLPYPYILKKRIDEWGINSHIITDKEHELLFSDLLTSPEYFCQELVPGKDEYTTHILFSRGKIVCASNIKFIFKTNYFIKGRNESPIQSIKIEQSPHLFLFSSILHIIGFEGLCCFNYKIVDDKPVIFEINPRFGASLSNHFLDFVRCLT